MILVNARPTNFPELINTAKLMTNQMNSVYGNNYTVQKVSFNTKIFKKLRIFRFCAN